MGDRRQPADFEPRTWCGTWHRGARTDSAPHPLRLAVATRRGTDYALNFSGLRPLASSWNWIAMLSQDSIAFLKQLLDSPGPSGFESAAARVWREEAGKVAEVTNDVTGNSVAIVNAGAPITVMLAGHIDEIGVIVNWIDDEGFVWIGPIGRWDPQVLIGQRIRFA